jgi:NDP-sugar pyrophosphorylase family protein
MAGGFGQRLGELTANKPKPLLPVGEKPILEHIVDRFIEAGFKRFYISTYYLSDQIIDFFGDGKSKGIEISYIEEEEPLGTGGALQLLPKNEINDTLIMMNADILSTLNFETFIRFHEEKKGIATMCVREYLYSIPYGVIKNENNSVTNIVEKPTYSYFINAGIYAIEPDFLDLVSEGNIDMPDLIQKMIANKKKINAFPVHEYWLDIGTTNDYHKAQIDIKYL